MAEFDDLIPKGSIRTGVMTSQEDPGALGGFTIAAGHGADKIGSGVKQLGLMAQKKWYESRGDAAGVARVQKELEALGEEQASRDEAYAPLSESRPVATALGGAVPYAVPMGKMATSVAGGALLGGLEYGTPQERLERGATMGALNAGGALAGQALRGVLSPGERVQSRNILTAPMTGDRSVFDRLLGFKAPDATGEILRNMEARGLKPYVSEIGGSTTARQAEDYLARAPGSAGVMAGHARRGQRVINTEAASAIGERARNLSAGVLDDATQRIGQTFEAVAALPGRPVSIGQNVGTAAQEVLKQQGLRPISADPVVQRTATMLQALAKNKGRLTGEAYNAFRSDLSTASNNAFKAGNSAAGRAYDDLLEALDSSAAQSLKAAGHGELAGSLVKARGEYANLMTLERGRTVSAAGDVNPQALATTLSQKYPRQFREGGLAGNPLYDIGRYGSVYPPLRSGSQTFERQAMQDLAEAPAQMATGAERAGPSMVGLATAPLNYAAAKYMTSPVARFLSRRGMLGQPTLSTTGGILSEVIARDIAAGMPGSAGILSEENY